MNRGTFLECECSNCGSRFAESLERVGQQHLCTNCGCETLITEPKIADSETLCLNCLLLVGHDSNMIGQSVACPGCNEIIELTGVGRKPPVIETREIPNDKVRCPNCHSTQLAAGSKGFRLGKAAVGGLLLGPIGLLGGIIGSRAARITCLNCGFVFDPGQGV